MIEAAIIQHIILYKCIFREWLGGFTSTGRRRTVGMYNEAYRLIDAQRFLLRVPFERQIDLCTVTWGIFSNMPSLRPIRVTLMLRNCSWQLKQLKPYWPFIYVAAIAHNTWAYCVSARARITEQLSILQNLLLHSPENREIHTDHAKHTAPPWRSTNKAI